MTNASGLRSLATLLELDEAVPYKMIREADPDGLVIALLRASADELDANSPAAPLTIDEQE